MKKHLPKTAQETFFIIAMITIALAGWLVFREIDKTDRAVNSNQVSVVNSVAEAEELSSDKKLIYAYKEGKTIFVRSLNFEADTKEDIISIEEQYEVGDYGDYFSNIVGAVNTNNDHSELVFIENNEIKKITLEGGDKTTLVSSSVSDEPLFAGLNNLDLNPFFKSEGPGIFTLGSPRFSNDESKVLFSIGHYEGISSGLIDTEKNEYIALDKTFIYIGAPTLKEKFTPVPDNKVLFDAGIESIHLFEETGTSLNGLLYGSKDTVYAILCPLDQPDSGHRQYVEDLRDEYYYGRDCGEEGPSDLVAISVLDGSYEDIAKVSNSGLALSSDNLYAAYEDLLVRALPIDSYTNPKQIDVVEIAGVSKDDVLSVRVDNLQRPTASIFYDSNGQPRVAVVDIKAKALVGEFNLAEKSAFKVLGLN